MPVIAIKSSKHPKMRSMFPLSDKTHNMDIRRHQKFIVQNAHTDRLKDSAIIYMQNLLNEHEN